MKCCFLIFFSLFGQKFQYVILFEVVHLTICKAYCTPGSMSIQHIVLFDFLSIQGTGMHFVT